MAEKKEKEVVEESPRDKKLKSLGIDPEAVDGWKKMFGRVELLKVGDKHFVYRPMKRLEWRQIGDQVQEADGDVGMVQEMTVSRCVLHPRGFSGELAESDAGVVLTLSEAIMKLSGFGAEEEPVEL